MKVFKAIIFYLFCFILALSSLSLIEEFIFQEKIYPRVFLNHLDLGKLTKEEAEKLLETSLAEFEKKGVVFSAATPLGEKKISLYKIAVSPADPDLSYKLYDFKVKEGVETVYQIGRKGNFLKRSREILGLWFREKRIELETEIKEEEIKKFLKEEFESLEKKPEQPRLEIQGKEIVLLESEEGVILDLDYALESFKKNLRDLKKEEISVYFKIVRPQIEKESCEFLFEDLKEGLLKNQFVFKLQNKKWPIETREIVSLVEFDFNEKKEIEVVLNQEKAISLFGEIAPQIEREPQEPKFKMENDRVVEFKPPLSGIKIDEEKSLEKIKQAILKGKPEIELVLEKSQPKTEIGDLNDLGIEELVGRGVSNFAGSSANRRHNIRVGAAKINGLLIKPEEEFSLVKALGRVDATTGFLPELVIKGDRTKPEFGGGLCQLGTTAFRVALDAGAPITARTPHTYRVRYYEPAGIDATIYDPAPDFRFINDTPAYLLLHTRVEGSELIFELYGTSDGRKVEMTPAYIYNIVSPPPKKIIYTEELEEGEKKKVESAVAGADTSFKRTITFLSGEKKEEIWKSHYVAWPEVWLYGGKPPEETETTSTPAIIP